jgi:hypothetical protein
MTLSTQEEVMKKLIMVCGVFLLALVILSLPVGATTATVSFTQLTGLTGGSPAATGVWRADLSGLGLSSLQSLTILDASTNLAGSAGQFSGFDLDAVKLSYSSVTTASAAASLVGLSVFDFSTVGTYFTPGAQTAPTDPKLFGTNVSGTAVNNGVATLGAFDGDSTTAIPGADGFVSMGVNGKISFNLTSVVSTTSGANHLYLYIGEVGDNGEVAAGTITVSDTPVSTPEPITTVLLGLGLLGVAGLKRRLLK